MVVNFEGFLNDPNLIFSNSFSWIQNVWHWRDLNPNSRSKRRKACVLTSWPELLISECIWALLQVFISLQR